MAPSGSSNKREENGGDVIGTALGAIKILLDTGGDVLQFAPIPGLDIAAKALSGFIGQIQKARQNKEAQKELIESTQALLTLVNRAMEEIKTVTMDHGPMSKVEIESKFEGSPELTGGVQELLRQLKDILEGARILSEDDGLIKRFLQSKRNKQILDELKNKVDGALYNFQTRGMIIIEGLIGDVRSDVKLILLNQRCEREERKWKQDDEALEKLPHVDASYRAGVVHDLKGGLTDGTRVSVLEEIEEWATRPSDTKDQAIYLMKGAFGTGKSAIAHEISKRLSSKGHLAASFFFLRDTPGLSSPNLVFSTVARQLALSQPLLRQYIVNASRSHLKHGVDKPSMEFQLRELIIEPLKRAPEDHPPVIIVMDGLDECSEHDPNARTRMLELLLGAVQKIPITLRILVATRPILDIEQAFRSVDKRELVLHDMDRAAVDADINLYLRRVVDGSSWGPALLKDRPYAIVELTAISEGVFIFVTTVVNFLASYSTIVVEIFDQIRSKTSDKSCHYFQNIDVLYLAILDTALSIVLKQLPFAADIVKKILSSVALLKEQLSLSDLSALLSIRESYARLVLERLKSVILLPDNPKHDIRPLHGSFPQFLIDRNRCTDERFRVDPIEGNVILAIACLGHFGEPGIVFRGSGNRSNEEPHVAYSCKYWITHLAASSFTPGLMHALSTFREQNAEFVREELTIMGYYDESSGESAGVSAQTCQTDAAGAELEYYWKHINKLGYLPHIDASYQIHKMNVEFIEGARSILLQEIEEWATRPASNLEECIFLLSGTSGSGKSAIACEVAKRLDRMKVFVAAYFYRRGDIIANFTRFLPCITCQLAVSISSLRPYIVEAARTSDFSAEQMARVLLGALMKLKAKSETITPIVAIVDLFDVKDSNLLDLVRIMRMMAAQVVPITLRFFVTSRRSPCLKEEFGARYFDLQCIPWDVAISDIALYMEYAIRSKQWGGALLDVHSDAVKRLTVMADNYFLLASTAIEFLDTDPDNVVRNYDVLLFGSSGEGHVEPREIDRLYAFVMDKAHYGTSDQDILRQILYTTALLQGNLVLEEVCSLLSIPQRDALSVLSPLRWFLVYSVDTSIGVRPGHAGFVGFLTNRERCTDERFHIDPPQGHAIFASASLKTLTKPEALRRNICGLPCPAAVTKEEIYDLRARVQKISPHVQYACVEWATHLSQSYTTCTVIHVMILKIFCKEKMLYWLEALSLLGKLHIASDQLAAVRTWYHGCDKHEDRDIATRFDNDVLELLDDTRRLVVDNFDAINHCPEMIYTSALPAMPDSQLFKTYSHLIE